MNKRNTLLYRNISLILFSKGGPSFVVIWEIDGETYTQRGDFFLSHTFFREPGGANNCIPLRAEMPMIGCMSLTRLPILCLCLNLTTWSSRSLLPVTHLLNPTALIPLCNIARYLDMWNVHRMFITYIHRT